MNRLVTQTGRVERTTLWGLAIRCHSYQFISHQHCKLKHCRKALCRSRHSRFTSLFKLSSNEAAQPRVHGCASRPGPTWPGGGRWQRSRLASARRGAPLQDALSEAGLVAPHVRRLHVQRTVVVRLWRAPRAQASGASGDTDGDVTSGAANERTRSAEVQIGR